MIFLFWLLITLSVGCLLADFLFHFIIDIIERWQVEQVVRYIVKVGTEETITGQYFLYTEDITRRFKFATPLWIEDHIDDVRNGIDVRKESLSETWLDFDENGRFVAWDCNFCGEYCPNWEED